MEVQRHLFGIFSKALNRRRIMWNTQLRDVGDASVFHYELLVKITYSIYQMHYITYSCMQIYFPYLVLVYKCTWNHVMKNMGGSCFSLRAYCYKMESMRKGLHMRPSICMRCFINSHNWASKCSWRALSYCIKWDQN